MDNTNIKSNEETIQTEVNYIFTSIDDFRERASENDYKEMEKYILEQKNRQGAFPSKQYKFSYSAASNELRKKGYLPITRKSKELKENITMTTENKENREHKTITISGGKNRVYKTRSYPFDQDVLERFDRMAEYYEDFSKKALLSEILDQGLKYFGF